MVEYKIDKILFLYRNLASTMTSQPPGSSTSTSQDIESGSPDTLTETTPLINRPPSIRMAPVQHWGVVLYVSNENENHVYAKIIEATKENGKVKSEFKDWDDCEEMSWRVQPGFSEKEVSLHGGEYPYDEEKVKDFIQDFNAKDGKYDPIFNNCQLFVNKLLKELNLHHLTTPHPFRLCFEGIGLIVVTAMMIVIFILTITHGGLYDKFNKWQTNEKIVLGLIWVLLFIFWTLLYAHAVL